MLTTTIDGLWVLQVLSGIEVVAPELGLRPHLPRAETRQMALRHPLADELRAAGAIATDGVVDDTVVEWLTVLSRRDVAVLLYVQAPRVGSEPERVLLARFAQWWAVLERCGAVVRLSGAGIARSEDSAGNLISTHIERLCGELTPAPVRPVTIDVGGLRTNVTSEKQLRAFLTEQGLDGEQVSALVLAADPQRSAQASMVAIQSGSLGDAVRTHIDSDPVTIIDTPQGRLVTEYLSRGGRAWMVISPGSPSTIASAAQRMLRRLPAAEWHSYRKVI